MENSHEQEHDHANALPHEDRGSRQFKGIRLRKWGSWVSEIRIPKSRKKIWLGSYATPEQAARAYDAAVYCLRGPNAKFNFPESVPDIPSASSLSVQQIHDAALKYALGPSQPPSCSPSLTGQASPSSSQSSSISEMKLSGETKKIPEEWPDWALWWSLFAGSDGGVLQHDKSVEFPKRLSLWDESADNSAFFSPRLCSVMLGNHVVLV